MSRRLFARSTYKALVADNARLRRERDQFKRDRDAYKAEAEAARRQLAEARALPEASSDEIAAWELRVKAHDTWVRPDNPDDRPYEGGSGRPTHPATDLVRALDRCRKLQALLDGRGRAGGAS
ncbi:hypothetical protein PV518_40870 [Streptomyces sp. ND04-05B]|uniref:hypothetical protein n=1 Tax=Streptomyces sp. ND04-05B TaxID=3028693 RepID=UPI0029AF0178|nr:hypothetical protein [Streptomyces sp. ND04-05B]MDX3068439.1 hypothetical protein [Streptomyces sp. ND04-05B]